MNEATAVPKLVKRSSATQRLGRQRPGYTGAGRPGGSLARSAAASPAPGAAITPKRGERDDAG